MKTIDEKTLKIAVLNAKNIAQVMIAMKRANSSAGREIIKKYIIKYNINISHFETTKERYERVLRPYSEKNIIIPNSEIFIQNSTYLSGNKIKKRLYDSGLKERKCEKCGQGEIWFGEKISLILDHANGTHNDNRLKNLKIYCPNCNATLATHCRGIKGLKKMKQLFKIKLIILKNYRYRNVRLNVRNIMF